MIWYFPFGDVIVSYLKKVHYSRNHWVFTHGSWLDGLNPLFNWKPDNFETELGRMRNVAMPLLKQQNWYLSVIIVCGYFSLIRSFTWLNFPWESNSYHKTSLSMTFGCWHLPGIPLFPLHFVVYTIAWQRTLLVIRFMADLLRKYRGSVVIMVGRGGAEPHYVHNWPPIFPW